MRLEDIDRDKLGKVLAYLGSEHDGEALAALHAARRLVAPNSTLVGFPDKLQRDRESDAKRRSSGAQGSEQRKLMDLIDRLRRRLSAQAREKAELSQMIDDLRQQIGTLESALAMKSREATDWRQRAWMNFWKSEGL